MGVGVTVDHIGAPQIFLSVGRGPACTPSQVASLPLRFLAPISIASLHFFILEHLLCAHPAGEHAVMSAWAEDIAVPGVGCRIPLLQILRKGREWKSTS